MRWALAQIVVAKANGFDDHSVRQLKQTAKDIIGMQSDIHNDFTYLAGSVKGVPLYLKP